MYDACEKLFQKNIQRENLLFKKNSIGELKNLTL